MGDDLTGRRLQVIDDFVERSGLVLSALIETSGRICTANSLFDATLGDAGHLDQMAVIEGDAQWTHVLADPADGEQVTVVAAATGVRVVLRLYREGERIRVLGVHLGGDQMMARIASDMAAAVFQSRRENRSLNSLASEATAASQTDPLTNLPNRRRLRIMALEMGASDVPFTCLMVDIDRFKEVNDRYGHRAGDGVLADVAAAVQGACRPGDVVIRYGGDEFAVILPWAIGDLGTSIAERVREAIQRVASLPDGHKVMVSIGVAVRRPAEHLDNVLDRADRALYDAKRKGRNRVEIAEP